MRGSLLIQLTEYADVTCTGLLFICIDRLDAPSSASSGCAGCSRSKLAVAYGLEFVCSIH